MGRYEVDNSLWSSVFTGQHCIQRRSRGYTFASVASLLWRGIWAPLKGPEARGVLVFCEALLAFPELKYHQRTYSMNTQVINYEMDCWIVFGRRIQFNIIVMAWSGFKKYIV